VIHATLHNVRSITRNEQVNNLSQLVGSSIPRVGERLPLERIAEAHEAVDSGRSGGRVVLDID
jgi:Zinc-binding dehydrogenase